MLLLKKREYSNECDLVGKYHSTCGRGEENDSITTEHTLVVRLKEF